MSVLLSGVVLAGGGGDGRLVVADGGLDEVADFVGLVLGGEVADVDGDLDGVAGVGHRLVSSASWCRAVAWWTARAAMKQATAIRRKTIPGRLPAIQALAKPTMLAAIAATYAVRRGSFPSAQSVTAVRN